MPILDIQKRARELGRIRIGQVVPTSNGKTRPSKLDRFRLTSASKPLLEKVAELYGGTVEEWEPQGGGPKAWEVITTSTRLPIMVPPQPVTQWYEYWTAGGCKHRCDGATNWLTGDPCDLESPDHLKAKEKPTTRLNVVLRDVEGIGVWRLETHGWNAAVELPNAAEFLAAAGGYVNGWVSLEERVSISDGKTKRFMVPIIEIDVTPTELMAGKGRVQPMELDGSGEQKAIGPSDPSEAELIEKLTPYYDKLDDAQTSDECMAIFQQAKDDGIFAGDRADLHPLVNQLYDAIGERGRALAAPTGDGVVTGEVADDDAAAKAAWDEILNTAGEIGAGLSVVNADFEKRMGLPASAASAGELRAYLELLQRDGVAA